MGRADGGAFAAGIHFAPPGGPARPKISDVPFSCLDLADAEKAALGGVENLVELPPETSEQLDWRPSTLFVTVHVRNNSPARNSCPKAA